MNAEAIHKLESLLDDIDVSDAINSLARADTEIAALREEVQNLKATSIHTCHAHCRRPLCVMRRERDAAQARCERLENELSRLIGYISPDHPACKSACALLES